MNSIIETSSFSVEFSSFIAKTAEASRWIWMLSIASDDVYSLFQCYILCSGMIILIFDKSIR